MRALDNAFVFFARAFRHQIHKQGTDLGSHVSVIRSIAGAHKIVDILVERNDIVGDNAVARIFRIVCNDGGGADVTRFRPVCADGTRLREPLDKLADRRFLIDVRYRIADGKEMRIERYIQRDAGFTCKPWSCRGQKNSQSQGAYG